jgi:DNA polymerase
MHEPVPFSTIATTTEPVHILHRDYETRSRLILKSVGTHVYAASASTEVLCCRYAVDDQSVQLWTPGKPIIPPEFTEAANNPNWIVAAHGDHFETAIEHHIMTARGWPEIPIERHVCTMARCLAVGLPARLSAAADAFELANRKDAAGERLMHQMSKPRKPQRRRPRRNLLV